MRWRFNYICHTVTSPFLIRTRDRWYTAVCDKSEQLNKGKMYAVDSSHLLLLDPDKLHFTDLMFQREDAAAEGRQQSIWKCFFFFSSSQRASVFLCFSFCIIQPEINYPTSTQKIAQLFSKLDRLFYCQSDWIRAISVIMSFCCAN